MTPHRLIHLLFWAVLWAMALMGLAAIVLFAIFFIEHVQTCRPPPSLDGPYRPDCFDAETVMALLLVYGAPLVLPLALALGIRKLIAS